MFTPVDTKVLLGIPVGVEHGLCKASVWQALEDPEEGWRWLTEDHSSHQLCALPQVVGVMSQSQRILKSKRQPQADRGNRINLFNVKVFTLHLSLRSAPIPLGQKGAYRNILWAEKTEGSDFQKSAVTFWFSVCFPEGEVVRFCIFVSVGVHI